MFGRRRIPDHLAVHWSAFTAQAERIESARQALLGCLPIGRVDPAPVPVGLDLLRDELLAVRRELGSWRTDEVESIWRACADAVGESLGHIAAAHRVAVTTTELDELLEAVSNVIEPLDCWQDAERRWRSLQVRHQRGR